LRRRRKRWKMLGGEPTGRRNRRDTDIIGTITDQDETREMMTGMRDLGGKRDRRKRKVLQRVKQDEKDTEMIRESAIDGTETLLGEIHKSNRDDEKRNLKTGDLIEEMRTAGHTEEMTTEEKTTEKITTEEVTTDEMMADEMMADEMMADEMMADEMMADEMMADEMMTGKDAGEGEKTSMTIIREIEADLLGVVKINI
jgi:hypothetical protein